MKEIKVFKILFILLLLGVNTNVLAQVSNPFTPKGETEFTKHDREKLEKKINENMNNKILSLEEEINRKLENIQKINIEKVQTNVTDVNNVDGNMLTGDNNSIFPSPLGLDNNQAPIVKETKPEKTALLLKLEKSVFIGCIDEQALFKHNETKEKFFVSQEEVEKYDEFKKIGDCSF